MKVFNACLWTPDIVSSLSFADAKDNEDILLSGILGFHRTLAVIAKVEKIAMASDSDMTNHPWSVKITFTTETNIYFIEYNNNTGTYKPLLNIFDSKDNFDNIRLRVPEVTSRSPIV